MSDTNEIVDSWQDEEKSVIVDPSQIGFDNIHEIENLSKKDKKSVRKRLRKEYRAFLDKYPGIQAENKGQRGSGQRTSGIMDTDEHYAYRYIRELLGFHNWRSRLPYQTEEVPMTTSTTRTKSKIKKDVHGNSLIDEGKLKKLQEFDKQYNSIQNYMMYLNKNLGLSRNKWY
jgi:hypothetical protein